LNSRVKVRFPQSDTSDAIIAPNLVSGKSGEAQDALLLEAGWRACPVTNGGHAHATFPRPALEALWDARVVVHGYDFVEAELQSLPS